MTLNDSIKLAVINYIEHLSFNSLDYIADENKETFIDLYKKGIIDDSSLEEALEKIVIRQAKEDYKLVTSIRSYQIYPDHLSEPACIAHAIGIGAFSNKEIKKIPFDHGEDAIEFCNSYGRSNLIKDLKYKIINKKEKNNFFVYENLNKLMKL